MLVFVKYELWRPYRLSIQYGRLAYEHSMCVQSRGWEYAILEMLGLRVQLKLGFIRASAKGAGEGARDQYGHHTPYEPLPRGRGGCEGPIRPPYAIRASA